ncbi:MAG TPA: RDD family protein [Candidatus Angelobacter sp.]|nr:RDD family protein [Candidatus Angelobacter sp.]
MSALIGNPITSIASLSGVLLIAVLAGLLFIEETGVPVPFAPGDLLLVIAGIAIASDTVDPLPMVGMLFAATVIGAMLGREVFSALGRPALVKIAETLHFRPALERVTHLLRNRGAPAVFVCRLIPGLRIHTTQVAGVSNLPRLTFAAGLIPSVVVYIAIFVGLGAIVGQPAVGLFHRAQHRFFVIAVTGLAVLAVVLSVRWLARRGVLSVLEPIVLGVRRDMADTIEATVLARRADDTTWRKYPVIRRLWAGLIDLAVVFGLTILLLTAVSGLDKTEVVLDPEGFILLAAVALVYRIPYEARTGQTIGKTMMGISVYGPHGGGPGWWRAGVRNLVGVLPPVWVVDAVLLLRSVRRQRLGDIITKTTVRRVAH